MQWKSRDEQVKTPNRLRIETSSKSNIWQTKRLKLNKYHVEIQNWECIRLILHGNPVHHVNASAVISKKWYKFTKNTNKMLCHDAHHFDSMNFIPVMAHGICNLLFKSMQRKRKQFLTDKIWMTDVICKFDSMKSLWTTAECDLTFCHLNKSSYFVFTDFSLWFNKPYWDCKFYC